MTDYELAVQLWQKRNIQNDAELAEALNGHSIVFAYHSGKIENERITYHDTREIFEHDGVTSYTGDLRTLFEIRNAKDANELFLVSFQERRPITEALVKEFQFKLTNNTYDTRRYQLGERSGEYKKHDYVTGKDSGYLQEMCGDTQYLLDRFNKLAELSVTFDDTSLDYDTQEIEDMIENLELMRKTGKAKLES